MFLKTIFGTYFQPVEINEGTTVIVYLVYVEDTLREFLFTDLWLTNALSTCKYTTKVMDNPKTHTQRLISRKNNISEEKEAPEIQLLYCHKYQLSIIY